MNEVAATLDEPAPTPQHTVLVVGHQRSGTTWLHRMLAAHPSATALPLHTLLFPSDVIQRPLARRRKPAWLARWEDRTFGPLDGLHRLRLSLPEEDEFHGWALCRSAMCRLDRPWPESGAPAIDGDDAAVVAWADAVARASRRTGRRIVSKNPHATSRLGSYRAALPGLRVVQLVRHPEAAIPSRLLLVESIWRLRFPAQGRMPAHEVRRIVEHSVLTYLGGHGQADLDLAYDELVMDPVGTLRRVHEALDLGPLDASTAQTMAGAPRAERSRERADCARFGVDPEELGARLAPVYERWGFRVGQPTMAPNEPSTHQSGSR